LFVTGELGGSLPSGRHLTFEPRLEEARWLADHFALHAMIDLSYGLAGDLPRLLHGYALGAELLAEAVPVSRAARVAARAGGKSPLMSALTDGEDYELLFAVAAADAVRLLDGWRAQFPGIRLTCLGKVKAERGVLVRDRKGTQTLEAHGYVHFQQS